MERFEGWVTLEGQTKLTGKGCACARRMAEQWPAGELPRVLLLNLGRGQREGCCEKKQLGWRIVVVVVQGVR